MCPGVHTGVVTKQATSDRSCGGYKPYEPASGNVVDRVGSSKVVSHLDVVANREDHCYIRLFEALLNRRPRSSSWPRLRCVFVSKRVTSIKGGLRDGNVFMICRLLGELAFDLLMGVVHTAGLVR